MKRLGLHITAFLLFILGVDNELMACDACKLNQPKITQDLTHGAGPESSWDWVIVVIIALLTLYTLIFSLKYLISPKEKNTDHIKHLILDEHHD